MRTGRARAAFVRFAAVLGLAGLAWLQPALADPAPFDLLGPSIVVSVTRKGVTLPIASLPQLATGDKVKVQVDLPASETAHYLLVAAFLRDPTNPPPDEWFYRSETWKPANNGGGAIDLTIPEGANHLSLFLAPATGGDFMTLRKAVQARPGGFIRAAQDLEQASLDRSRFETYLATIRKVAATTPELLARDAPVIAGSLRIKINEDCLQRQTEFQTACLLDSKQALVMGGDGIASNSAMTDAAADLVLALTASPAGGSGYYSPYVGAIKDIINIFGAMHTANYQYIPALGLGHGDKLALILNTPPSFADPKSVMMVALPEIRPPIPLIPRAEPGSNMPCLGAKEPLVPLAISPLYYSTAYAHDLSLRAHLPDGSDVELPIVADPVRGGLVIAPGTTVQQALVGPITAKLHGMWGFDAFTGPDVTLAVAGDWNWQRKETAKSDGLLTLVGAASSCVAAVTVTQPQGPPQPASWKVIGPDEIAVTLPSIANRHEQLAIAIEGPPGTTAATLTVAPPAKPAPPAARIVARFSEPAASDQASLPTIQLDDADEIPANARLSFTLKAEPGERFTGREVVEVGTTGSDTVANLTIGNGLTLLDPSVLVASLTPSQALGSSVYGPLRVRMVRGDVAADWLRAGTLVRLPRLKALDCPADPAAKCMLHGDALYLLASVAPTHEFDGATSVPEGYPGSMLEVARPGPDGTLYVRLHDAPEAINRAKMPVAAPVAH